MTNELTLRMLTDAGLSTDWMTVYVGWRGIQLRPEWKTAQLPFDEARALAINALASSVGTSLEHDVFLVADSETEHEGEDALLRLAKAAGISEDAATRKWRYAFIHDALPRIMREEVYSHSIYGDK